MACPGAVTAHPRDVRFEALSRGDARVSIVAMPASPQPCVRCRHFFVTWEQPRSKGCRAYAFKSERYPSVVVLETSGSECRQFEPPVAPTGRRERRDGLREGDSR